MTWVQPFVPASIEAQDVMCTVCGRYSPANAQISAYPHRYIPRGWVVHTDGRLRCRVCVGHGDEEPRYARAQEVWVGSDGRIDSRLLTQEEREMREAPTSGISGVQLERVIAFAMKVAEARELAREPYNELARRVANRHLQAWERRQTAETAETAETAAEGVSTMGESTISAGTVGFEVGPQEEREAVPEQRQQTRGQRFKSQGKSVGSALMLGGTLAVADQVGEALLDVAKEIAKDVPYIAVLLEVPEGREIAKMLVALGLNAACHHTEMVPKAGFVTKATEMQLALSSYKLITPRLSVLRDHLGKLAGFGEQIAEIEGVRAPELAESDDEQWDRVEERATAAAEKKAGVR